MTNQNQIKLFKQLISLATDKASKKQLQNMLNQTMNDSKTKTKSKTFSVYKQPAAKIKDLGFKTKKQFTEFTKTNQFQTKGFNSEAEFNKYYKNKLNQYNTINEIMNKNNNHTKTRKALEKKFNEIANPKQSITTMCLFFIKLSEGTTRDHAQRLAGHKLEFPKDNMVSDRGNIYKQVHVQRLNVIDANINNFVNTRTYDYQNKEFNQLWKILKYDINAPERKGESSSPISLVIVKNA